MALPERARGLLIDLDGTVIESGELIPGVAEGFRALIDKESEFVTNIASKPPSAI